MNVKDLKIYVSIADSAVENLLISFLRHRNLRVFPLKVLQEQAGLEQNEGELNTLIATDQKGLGMVFPESIKNVASTVIILFSNEKNTDQLIRFGKQGVDSIMHYPPNLEAVENKITEFALNSFSNPAQLSTELLIDKAHSVKPIVDSQFPVLAFTPYLNLIDTNVIEPIFGKSLAIQHLRDIMEHLSKNVSMVFVQGEFGTSVDKVAAWIHKKSKLRMHEMAKVCCIGLSASMLQDFFDSLRNKISTNKRTNSFINGTIYISNLQELDQSAQNIFYRNYEGLLKANVITSSTSNEGFRLIVSARSSIKELVKKGVFRSDLFQELQNIVVHVPELKERTDDIPQLAERYLNRFMEANPHYQGKSFAPNALTYLQSLNWPGNDAELKRKVERICSLVQHPLIMTEDIKRFVNNSSNTGQIQNLFEKYDDFQSFKDASERLFLSHFLDKYAWNVSKAAEAIKIQRSHLYNKIKKYHIVRD